MELLTKTTSFDIAAAVELVKLELLESKCNATNATNFTNTTGDATGDAAGGDGVIEHDTASDFNTTTANDDVLNSNDNIAACVEPLHTPTQVRSEIDQLHISMNTMNDELRCQIVFLSRVCYFCASLTVVLLITCLCIFFNQKK